MNLPGHLVTAYLLARRRSAARWARLGPASLGVVVPDLIDKSIQAARLSPYGRTIGHSLVLWGYALGFWMIASALRLRRAPTLGLVVGGGWCHLMVDAVDDVVEGFERTGYAFSAWFGWPYTNPDMWNVRCPHLGEPAPVVVTSLEVATVLAAAALAWLDHRRAPIGAEGSVRGRR